MPVCEKNGIEYTEIQIANDGIAVVTNIENDWATCLTVEQLNKIWGPDSKVDDWNQVDPSFPDQKMTLAGPGTDSGTFDFFTAEINGEEDASRTDYQATEDNNVIVQAVEGDMGGLGYFGLSYFEQNQEQINDVEVDGGDGCVAPTTETVQDGSYTPLSRPLFIYVKNDSLQKPEVKAFVQYILDNEQTIAENALFVPLTDEQLQESQSTFDAAASWPAWRLEPNRCPSPHRASGGARSSSRRRSPPARSCRSRPRSASSSRSFSRRSSSSRR